jgi:hypothetical protein
MLTGNCLLYFNSALPLTMDAKWSKSSSVPINVAQGGLGPLDLTAGKGETHQFQIQLWCQLNGFEFDFERMKREKFDVEFIAGEIALGGTRERYGPCLMSQENLNVDNAGGIVYVTGTLIALRKKR